MKSATRHHVEWLSAESAAAYLDFPNVGAFYDFIEKAPNAPQIHYIGRRVRFRRTDLDAVPERKPRADESARPTLKIVGKGR